MPFQLFPAKTVATHRPCHWVAAWSHHSPQVVGTARAPGHCAPPKRQESLCSDITPGLLLPRCAFCAFFWRRKPDLNSAPKESQVTMLLTWFGSSTCVGRWRGPTILEQLAGPKNESPILKNHGAASCRSSLRRELTDTFTCWRELGAEGSPEP